MVEGMVPSEIHVSVSSGFRCAGGLSGVVSSLLVSAFRWFTERPLGSLGMRVTVLAFWQAALPFVVRHSLYYYQTYFYY